MVLVLTSLQWCTGVYMCAYVHKHTPGHTCHWYQVWPEVNQPRSKTLTDHWFLLSKCEVFSVVTSRNPDDRSSVDFVRPSLMNHRRALFPFWKYFIVSHVYRIWEGTMLLNWSDSSCITRLLTAVWTDTVTLTKYYPYSNSIWLLPQPKGKVSCNWLENWLKSLC